MRILVCNFVPLTNISERKNVTEIIPQYLQIIHKNKNIIKAITNVKSPIVIIYNF